MLNTICLLLVPERYCFCHLDFGLNLTFELWHLTFLGLEFHPSEFLLISMVSISLFINQVCSISL